jgi:hypothetical protein
VGFFPRGLYNDRPLQVNSAAPSCVGPPATATRTLQKPLYFPLSGVSHKYRHICSSYHQYYTGHRSNTVLTSNVLDGGALGRARERDVTTGSKTNSAFRARHPRSDHLMHRTYCFLFEACWEFKPDSRRDVVLYTRRSSIKRYRRDDLTVSDRLSKNLATYFALTKAIS